MKKLLLAVSAFGIALCMYAQNTDPSVVIERTDGQEATTVAMSPDTKITFDGDKMIVTLAGDQTIEVPIANIAKINFDAESSVDDITAIDLDDVTFNVNGPVVTIIANNGPLKYAAFSMAGQLVAAGADGTQAVIDFSKCQPGVYVIKANNKVLKFINK